MVGGCTTAYGRSHHVRLWQSVEERLAIGHTADHPDQERSPSFVASVESNLEAWVPGWAAMEMYTVGKPKVFHSKPGHIQPDDRTRSPE